MVKGKHFNTSIHFSKRNQNPNTDFHGNLLLLCEFLQQHRAVIKGNVWHALEFCHAKTINVIDVFQVNRFLVKPSYFLLRNVESATFCSPYVVVDLFLMLLISRSIRYRVETLTAMTYWSGELAQFCGS